MTSTKNILITGGSGLVGKELTKLLLQEGFNVRWIGRSGKSMPNVKGFKWDYKTGYFELAALKDVSTIIHLAGAGVGDKRWTKSRKKELYESRIETSKLLAKVLKEEDHHVEQVIAASAIGIYPQNEVKQKNETDSYGNDFLGNLTVDWEKQLDQIGSLTRLVKLRIGVVLSMEGGALPKLVLPIKLFVGAPLGSGDQILSWIHIRDLCKMFLFATEHKSLVGAYNAVHATNITNRNITKAIAKQLKKPLILPFVPGFMLRLLLGEMANIALGGCAVGCQKILDEGFSFEFDNINSALKDLLVK